MEDINIKDLEVRKEIACGDIIHQAIHATC